MRDAECNRPHGLSHMADWRAHTDKNLYHLLQVNGYLPDVGENVAEVLHGAASIVRGSASIPLLAKGCQKSTGASGASENLGCRSLKYHRSGTSDAEVRFLRAPPPRSERMTAVLARVHMATAAENDDHDPTLAVCVKLGLAGPHLAAPPEPTARHALTDTGTEWMCVLSHA